MDPIPFTKVTLEEAKAALHSDPFQQPVVKPAPPKHVREAPAESSAELTLAAFKWLAGLPRDVRPHALGRRYPRIVNRLAEIWQRPVQCERFLDELLLDKRGGRAGFPPEVASDIATLKVHFLATSNIAHYDVWGTRVGVE